jgi:hypothetical protein
MERPGLQQLLAHICDGPIVETSASARNVEVVADAVRVRY